MFLHKPLIGPFCTMPRKQDFDKKVEKAVTDLLDSTPRSDPEVFNKVVNTAITWAKVKHKIEEGSAGSAFNTPEDPTE